MKGIGRNDPCEDSRCPDELGRMCDGPGRDGRWAVRRTTVHERLSEAVQCVFVSQKYRDLGSKPPSPPNSAISDGNIRCSGDAPTTSRVAIRTPPSLKTRGMGSYCILCSILFI